MKRALLLFAAFIGTTVSSIAQVTSISVETFYTDNGSIAGYPAGHTTYRIYANTTNNNDRVVVASGDDIHPLVINVGGSGIWNYNPGGVLGDAAPCNIYSLSPLAEYDSYLTIGYSCNNDGSLNQVYSAEDSNSPWQNQLFGTIPYGIGNAVVNTPVGATWFVLPTNAVSQAGVDNKVLLGQITTDGDICGIFNLQVFPNFVNPGDPYVVQNGLQFGTGSCGTPGCTDPTATNYDNAAGFDNGLCLYPCAIDITSLVATGPTCFGQTNGSIEVQGAGNQSYIEYFLNDVSQGLSNNGSDSYTGLGNGSYTVVLHDSRFDNALANPANLVCEATQVVELNTEELVVTSSVPVGATCAGDTDGCVSTVPANYYGGTGDLSFMIYNNSNVAVQDGSGNDLVLPDPNYCGLAGGIYHFVATDANGCTATGNNFTVTNPATLTLFAGNQTPASCFNTSDAVQVLSWAGGTGDVDFSLVDDGIYEIEGNPANVILNNLAGGSTNLYAMDANGCTASLTFNVAAGPQITITPAVVDALCNGDINGSISLMAGGGTGTLQFSFDGVSYSAASEMMDIAAGDYTAYVKDANDCIATADITVAEPEILTATVVASNISCNNLNDGAISVTANGGTEPYAYSTTDAGYTPSSVLGGLSAGSYDTYVADAHGCVFVITGAATITNPAALTASNTSENVSCNGLCDGSITVDAAGGTGALSYSANGGPASNSSVWNDLCANTYDIVVSDVNGCTTNVDNVVITEPTAIVITGLAANPIDEDAGGNTAYTVAGGAGGYTYSWTGPGGFTSNSQNLPALNNDTQDGDYVLTVSDANGCSSDPLTITVTGVSELGHTYSISLYPNPNNGDFNINIAGMKGEKMNYAVVDANGRIAMAKELGNVNGTRIENVDITGMAAGIYHVQFMIGNELHSLRFVKN